MKAKIKDFVITIDRRQMLTLILNNDFKEEYDKLKDKDLSVEIKRFFEKRSIDANALCWKLCTEIADILRTKKDDVYLQMLKSYGQSTLVSVRSDINVKGFFKYYDEAGISELNGKSFTHYKVYKGSSEYDTREMSVLLDGIVNEAKELDIQVLSAGELDLMKKEWDR